MIGRLLERLETLERSVATAGVQRACLDIAMLVARVALAWIFIYHGAETLFGAFGGIGIHGQAVYFSTTAHLHPGTFFAVLNGITEFFGGIAVGVGFLGRFAAVGLFGDMVIAMITVTFKNGIVSNAVGSGYELNLALAGVAGAVMLLGTGRIGVGFALRELVRRRIGAPGARAVGPEPALATTAKVEP